MFHQESNYPLAVTSKDDEGIAAGVRWCLDHMGEGERLTVWTKLKKNLPNSPLLSQLVASNLRVDHITDRGGAYTKGRGPALMAWAHPSDISEFTSNNTNRVSALCVISLSDEKLRPWVSAAGPELLGDTSAWKVSTPSLDPVVEEGMEDMTLSINHNNTIAVGYEKDTVVSILQALHRAGYDLDGPALAGWAVAHGWTHDNPAILEKYVNQINTGRGPRVSIETQPGYIEDLRARAAETHRSFDQDQWVRATS